MWRFLAGVASALLLSGAGMIWWTNGARQSPALAAFEPPLARTADWTNIAEPPQAEERTREQKRFDRYDKDRNDLITTEEYLTSRRKAYAKLDTNGDGRLTFDEWARKTTDKFAKADTDKSKSLSRTEFATTKTIRKAAPVRACPPPREDGDES